MSDPTDPTDMEPRVDPPRRSFWRNLSVIWLVPILALAISLWIAYRSYSERGALIRITFENAGGITAGETTVRYRDVVIGTVEDVSFTPDLSKVEVSARIAPVVADTIPSDASFWVVRPEVSTRGISGLNTVLSGVYIQASFDPVQQAQATRFKGLEDAPLVQAGEQGTRITIHAKSGNMLAAGAPVIYQGIEVGKIEAPQLNPDGDGVIVKAFVQAPYDDRLTTATRFWDMSGFSVSFGASGLTLDVASLASLVSGGVAFDTVLDNGQPIAQDRVFELYSDESTARSSVFGELGANAVKFAIDFTGTVNGLSAGAPVRYKGIKVGEVGSISAVVETVNGRQAVRLRSTVTIDPQAMGLAEDAGRDELLGFLRTAIADNGLRAQLATANLFSSSLLIELVEVPDAAPAELTQPEGRLPMIPSVTTDIPDVTATAEGVLKRINGLPIEEVMNQAISLMASIEAIAEDDGTRAAPEAILGLVNDARDVIGAEATKQIPGELRDALAELRTITSQLAEQGAVDSLVSALKSADKAAASIADTTEQVPALVDDLRALAAKANALDAETLIASANKVLGDADALIGSEAAQNIPPALSEAIGQIRDIVASLNEQNTAEKLASALESADAAAKGVTSATEGIPELSDQLSALAAKANALDAETLVASANQLLANANAVIGTEAARNLPPALTDALDQVRGLVGEFRDTRLAEKLADALTSADAAAQQVTTSAEGVPELVDQLSALSKKANALDAETLVASATRVLNSADAVIGTDSAQQLPQSLTSSLEEIRGLVAELRQSGAVKQLVDTLISADETAQVLTASAEGVPELVQQLNDVAAKANRMDIETLVASSNDLVRSADALIGSDSAREVPPALAGALQQVRDALADLRAGGVVENTNATLASARKAADSIAQASESLPQIAERLDAVASQASGLIATYSDRSNFNKDTLAMLREVREAARSVAQLARQIERNPNSLILGR